jgi:hypothetical protein
MHLPAVATTWREVEPQRVRFGALLHVVRAEVEVSSGETEGRSSASSRHPSR